MLGFHNLIYDRGYLGLPEKVKAEIKEKGKKNEYRISGKSDKKYDAHKIRRDQSYKREI